MQSRCAKAPQLNEMAEVDDYWEMVPGRWSVDENSVHAREASARHPRNRADDVRTETTGWTRRHAKPRVALFTSIKVAGGPRNGLSLGEVRMTMGQYVGGGAFRRADLWKDLEDAHSLRPEPWTGYTTFMTKEEFSERLPPVSTRRVSNY